MSIKKPAQRRGFFISDDLTQALPLNVAHQSTAH
ncbi:hypothetical protein CSE899_08304 [Cronobacter sakazakii E899]|nr:hypothetical protein CSE899_08304 [Cronobacter sakazakii E899]